MTRIMPDMYYAEGVLPTIKQIENKESFDINWLSNQEIRNKLQHTAKSSADLTDDQVWDWGEWSKVTADGDRLNKPGMAPAAEAASFIAELTYESKFLQECDFQTAENPNQKFHFIKLENRLQGARRIEEEPYKQIRHLYEREPGSLTSRIEEVIAEPYISYIEIPRTLMIENLERGRFLHTVMPLDTNSRQHNVGEISLYAIRDHDAGVDGLNINDGLLKQLDDRHEEYVEKAEDTSRPHPQGYYSGIEGSGNTDKIDIDFGLTYTDDGTDAIREMMKMSAQYDLQQQQGSVNKKFLVSPEVFSQLQIMQTERETGLGDKLIMTPEGMRINDCLIEKAIDLAFPKNGYNQHILLGDFKAGYCNCMIENFQTHWEYHQYEQQYVGDTYTYWAGFLKDPTKILAAEVTNLPSQTAGSSDGQIVP